MQTEEDLESTVIDKRNVGIAICERIITEINKLGFAVSEINRFPVYDDAAFSLIKDPFTGQCNLTGYWYTAALHYRIGSLQFNSDGSVYAEYDVAKQHPTKAHWFIESVTVWGKGEQLKAEAKLLPMPK